MPKVSVLMPCLNVRAFIQPCMASVVQQTLADLEILVIDAGSTDGTLEVVEKYAREDPRVRVLHSPVKSYGYQMNLGIREADGEYIGIIETDDYIEPDAMEQLYRAIQGTDAEYVKGYAEAFYEDAVFPWHFFIYPAGSKPNESPLILNPQEHPQLSVTDGFLWTGIYRADYLKQISFHETPGAAFQDISALFQILSRAHKGIYLDHLVYHYRQSNAGASSYQSRSMDYVKEEYAYLEAIAKEAPLHWQNVYYLRMLLHVLDRFEFMEAGGFWSEAAESLQWLVKKIQEGIDARIFIFEDLPEDWKFEWWMLKHNPLMLLSYLKDRDVYRAQFMYDYICSADRELIVFGAGIRGTKAYEGLKCFGHVSICGYCDNSPEKQGTTLHGLAIWSVEDAVRQFPDGIFILANAKYADNMAAQLRNLGISNDQIIKSTTISIYTNGVVLRWLEKLFQKTREA